MVGSQSIRQGYIGSLSAGQAYTEIRISFENTVGYDRALGLNIVSGQLTGCAVRNIKHQPGREIACTLNIGEHTND